MKRRRISVFGVGAVLLCFVSVVSTPSEVLAITRIQSNEIPKGAIKLGTSLTGAWSKKIGVESGVSCWLTKGSYQPGEKFGVYNKRSKKWTAIYFLSYAQRSANALAKAKKVRGSAKAIQLREASLYSKKGIQLQPLCKKFNRPRTALVGKTALALVDKQILKTSAYLESITRTQASGSKIAWGSNIAALATDSSAVDALVDGALDVQSIYKGANEKFFLILKKRQIISDTGYAQSKWGQSKLSENSGCLLVELNSVTGSFTCIDSTISSIQGKYSPIDPKHPLEGDVIQTDGTGNAYYVGSNTSSDPRKSPITILRRTNASGSIDLLTGYISISDFMVLPDGTVLVSGSTNETNSWWTRKISPSGTLTGLSSSSCVFRRFPDDQVFTVCGTAWFRYDAAAESLVAVDAPMDRDVHIVGILQNKEIVTRAGSSLMIAYPTVSTIGMSQITSITLAKIIGNSILISGMKNGKSVTSAIQISSGVETVLINSSPIEYEIYQFGEGNESSGNISLAGLRFSDGQYVAGHLNIKSGELQLKETGLGKFESFLTISS